MEFSYTVHFSPGKIAALFIGLWIFQDVMNWAVWTIIRLGVISLIIPRVLQRVITTLSTNNAAEHAESARYCLDIFETAVRMILDHTTDTAVRLTIRPVEQHAS